MLVFYYLNKISIMFSRFFKILLKIKLVVSVRPIEEIEKLKCLFCSDNFVNFLFLLYFAGLTNSSSPLFHVTHLNLG